MLCDFAFLVEAAQSPGAVPGFGGDHFEVGDGVLGADVFDCVFWDARESESSVFLEQLSLYIEEESLTRP